MELYHGTLSDQKGHDVLRHHGSLLASIHRINSMFCSQNSMGFDGEEFIVSNIHQQTQTRASINDIQERFVSYISQARFSKLNVDIQNPLRLSDCWEDDPIGSGALEIFNGNDALTTEQRADLQSVFRPFEKIIYPHDVASKLSQKSLKAVQKFVRENKFAKEQLKKRKGRSKAIGEDFRIAAAHENVWIYLTIKLRDWALRNDFDSFVYLNSEEGEGCDSYVTLKPKQSSIVTSYEFDMERYKAEVAPLFERTLKEAHSARYLSKPKHMAEKMYWADKDPKDFLKATP